MSKGDAAKAPDASVEPAPRVLVQRALPTDPAIRGSVSLFLIEAERQGIRADRQMLYAGLEPASEHLVACLRVEPGDDVVARRKLMLANDVPVRIATSFFAPTFSETPAWPSRSSCGRPPPVRLVRPRLRVRPGRREPDLPQAHQLRAGGTRAGARRVGRPGRAGQLQQRGHAGAHAGDDLHCRRTWLLTIVKASRRNEL